MEKSIRTTVWGLVLIGVMALSIFWGEAEQVSAAAPSEAASAMTRQSNNDYYTALQTRPVSYSLDSVGLPDGVWVISSSRVISNTK